jgi:hypothetical protein
MSKSWNNFVLIMLLALLQGFAPLLHAHVHDISQPGKMHFHAFEFDAPHSPVESGVQQLTSHLADSDAIGVESVGKNDHEPVVQVDAALALPTSPFSQPFALAPPLPVFAADINFPAHLAHRLPPPQAPPGVSLN